MYGATYLISPKNSIVMISIITICRNDVHGLKSTFASIIKQTCNLFEWIVVDGNSSDDTVAWLTENHLLRGVWISEPDNGIYDAMQKGLNKSTGEYVIYLNSGDALAGEQVIEKIYNSIKDQRPSLIYGDAWDISLTGKRMFRPARNSCHVGRGMFTHHQAMFFKRDSLLDFPGFNSFKLSGDYAMVCWSITKKDGALRVPFPICNFLIGGAHEIYRLKAMREDFNIRIEYLDMNRFYAAILYFAHLVHYLLKKLSPTFIKKLRGLS